MMENWINNAQLIPEGKSYKVDSAGRIAIPSHLRAKFGIQTGSQVEYYTAFEEGKWFMCITPCADPKDGETE